MATYCDHNRNMRRRVVGLFVLFLAFSFLAPANSANRTTLLTKAFQKYLIDAEASHTSALAQAKKLYEPQISSAQIALSTAVAQFKNVSEATVLISPPPSDTELRNYISVLKCPVNSDCKMPGTPTGGYSVGAKTSILDFIGGEQAFATSSAAQMNLGILQTVDLGLSHGLFKLSSPNEYAQVATSIRTQYQNLVSLSTLYSKAQSDADLAFQESQNMESTIKSAILSAKRAASSPSSFDKSFITSFKFEYNAKRLDELAREPWTYISSLKALQDAVSVTKQSTLADSISSSYSFSSASKFNSTYGNLFLSEDQYRSAFGIINSIYKSTTGISLVGK